MSRKAIDLVGQKFGRLTVVKRSSKVGENSVKWLCRCECGKEKITTRSHLKSGTVKSCGCLLIDTNKKTKTKHGLSNDELYDVYHNMTRRCYDVKNEKYSCYGARGISVCEEWMNVGDGINNFVSWCKSNGYEKGLQIDRIDNDGNYEPSNCRFVTSRQNSLNRRMLKSNTSGYEGISFRKDNKKWTSRIKINFKDIYLGCFKTIEDAVIARNNYIMENNLQHEYKIQEVN